MTQATDINARAMFAGGAMQALLSALVTQAGTADELTGAVVTEKHRAVCAAAWRTADVMLATEQAGRSERGAFLLSLNRVIALAAEAARELKSEAAEAMRDAQTSDAAGVTAKARDFAAQRQAEAARIEGDVNRITEFLNL